MKWHKDNKNPCSLQFCTLVTISLINCRTLALSAFANPINQQVIWVGSVFIWFKERLAFVLEWHFMAVFSETKADIVAVTQPRLWPCHVSSGPPEFYYGSKQTGWQENSELKKLDLFPLLICQLNGYQRRTANVREAPQSFCPSLHGLASTPNFIKCCVERWEYQNQRVVVSQIIATSCRHVRHFSWYQLFNK